MGNDSSSLFLQHRMDISNFLTTHRGKPFLLEGGNFSGRTALLRHCATRCSRQGTRAIYVGSSINRYLSSLMPNVRDELHLHVFSTRHEKSFLCLAESLGLTRCFHQDPFTLSGGEQTLLVTLCKLGLEPTLFACDSALGELDPENLVRVTQVFSSPVAENTTTLLTENGYAEDRPWNLSLRRPVSDFTNALAPLQPPRFQASDFQCTPRKNVGYLEAEGLSFAYKIGFPVLHNAFFRLAPGRVYSLEGKNGAGKSTLARILVGALPLHQGQISFGGRNFKPWKNPGQVVVMHMQNPDVQLSSSSVSKELSDLPNPSRQPAATLAGVENLMTEHPFDLPFVLRKRLTFSVIAHLQRPWLIFDEPTLGQDACACDQMVAVLRHIAKNGSGVIVISHSQEFVRRLEARRLRLENGVVNELTTGNP